MKIFKRLMLIILSIVVLYSAYIMYQLYALGIMDAKKLTVIERVKSMDSNTEAVIAEVNTNATVSRTIEVFILPTGSPIKGEPVLRVDKFENIKANWTGKYELLISGNSARVFLYSKQVPIKLNNFETKITVNLNINKIDWLNK